MLHLLIIFLGLCHQGALGTKWYSGSPGFSSSDAWIDGYMPCARDLAVFPSNYRAVLPLTGNIKIGGFVLPNEGALVLSQDVTILLNDLEQDRECESDEKRAYLKPPKTSKWFDPMSWTSPDILSRSPAVSEIEKVPCSDEQVVITSANGALSFDLENVLFLRLGHLSLLGSSISKTYLQQLLRTDLGELLFPNGEITYVEYYRSEICGCHKDYMDLIVSTCHNVECERPHCVSPVLPLGACCPICGATVRYSVEHCLESERKDLLDYINKQMVREGLTNDILVHVEFISSDELGQYLQTVIVDRDTYNERSKHFLELLMERRNESNLLRGKQALVTHMAGHPYNPNVTFGSVLLIIFCIVLVGVVAIIILAHYMPQNPHLNRIPQWIHDPRRWHWSNLSLGLRRNLLFARFDNAGQEAGISGGGAAATSGVEHLPERIMGFNAESEEVRERAFNNPMFEEGITAQAVSTDVASNKQTAPEFKPTMEVGELDSCNVEEQELTEIRLESSDSDSDVEEETAK
ncbi:protein amnionless [Scaptodrosophila lebanonensis]|uniref:Protein amnionless n=1 Tax=Drosophila lebanonensis TaxID=7225 RepID=A0A6J2UBW6_DROLE|nr:protein amnionless [Scaptodrosophila lebanonensis]